MKVKEFIEFVNNSNFSSLNMISVDDWWICSEELNSFSEMYNVYTDIYKCEDGFVGVTGVIPKEGYTPEEIGIPCRAEEFVPIPSIKYVSKTSINELAFKH